MSPTHEAASDPATQDAPSRDSASDSGSRRGSRLVVSRRALFQLSALGGGSALALGLLEGAGGPAAAASSRVAPLPSPPAPPVPNPATGIDLFSDQSFNFEALFALGGVPYGAGEVGEVIETANAINAQGLSYQTYYNNFVATAQRVGQIADTALRGGHHVSAREAYLRSAAYYDQALFFVLGTSTPNLEASVYSNMQQQWNRASQLFDPPFERISIPYERTTLPGYFLKPSASGTKRPTVIICNGSDAENVDVWSYGAAAAIARGYNALIFEGPGQGSTLFLRKIPFRPDWEKVITPVVDYLHTRSDVDTKRIALTGWSFSGELVIRAAAFEKRLAAVVTDPGSVNTWNAYPEYLRNILNAGSRAVVNATWTNDVLPTFDSSLQFLFKKRAEIYGRYFLDTARAGRVFTDFWLFGTRASQYTNASVSHLVNAPVLVTNYELEEFYPGQAQLLYQALRSHKDLVTFTVAEGAEYHDAPMAPQRRNQVVFDWLDDTLH